MTKRQNFAKSGHTEFTTKQYLTERILDEANLNASHNFQKLFKNLISHQNRQAS